MISRERIIALLQWFILLAIFAYDGFTYLSEESNFALIKSAYYLVIFFAFVFVITLQMQQGKLPNTDIGHISLLVQAYIWLYFIRICIDFMVVGIDQEIVTNPFAAVFLYVNAAIIPFYGMFFFKWELINLRKLNAAMLLIFLAMGMTSIYYILTGRAAEYILSDGRFMGNASMDTIAFGHLGASITLLALSLFYQPDIRWLHKALSIFSILAGLIICLAAGSRGALVALIICFVMYFYMNGHKRKILIGLPILAVLFVALLPILNDLFLSFDNHAFERFYDSIYNPDSLNGGVTSGRDSLYVRAWDRIMDSPIWGTSLFLEGEYVHNSILESFMGLGFIGGFLFLAIILHVAKCAIRLGEQDKQYLFISLLFIQYIMYSLFSRTLSMLPLFWLFTYLVIFTHNTNARKKRELKNE